MPDRYFTVDEVNGLVPELEQIFARVMQLRSQLKSLYHRLEQKGFAPSGDDFNPVVPAAPPDVIRDRFTFRGLMDVLKSELGAVQKMGCQIKDIEVGLVDWYARSGDRDVFLCWRFGEKAVAFFHDVEAGFAGRRPVSELGR